MKPALHTLLTTCLVLLASCTAAIDKSACSPAEEQRVAHEYLAKANSTGTGHDEQRSAMFDKATYHFANIVVRPDADDTLRADALYTLRWIEAYIRHNYELALQYLNQYMTLVGPEHDSYPICLAFKADDLWHFGAQDSAVHYAYKAMGTPHKVDDGIDYTCHYILWNIYEAREMPDSASHHKALYMKIRESREFEPMTMDELKSKLASNIISPDVKAGTEAFGAFAEIRAKRVQEEMERKHQRQNRNIHLAILLMILLGIAILLHGMSRRKRKPAPSVPGSTTKSTETDTSPTKAQLLANALTEGRQTFEHTPAYSDMLTMQVNEKELPAVTYSTTRQLEQSMLTAFNDSCCILIACCELNDQELICLLGSHIGYSNTIIAHIGHTTTATIRKRKERIKKKLPAVFYDVIFGSNGHE